MDYLKKVSKDSTLQTTTTMKTIRTFPSCPAEQAQTEAHQDPIRVLVEARQEPELVRVDLGDIVKGQPE
jgi:hypothetical protein